MRFGLLRGTRLQLAHEIVELRRVEIGHRAIAQILHPPFDDRVAAIAGLVQRAKLERARRRNEHVDDVLVVGINQRRHFRAPDIIDTRAD